MFGKILVANRGEIALRVLRTCRELGIRSVAVHSTVDADAGFVTQADEAVCVGPGPAGRSYLNVPNVVEAALAVGADAIHPGYGFLSEDPFFAEICAENDITFIGPPPDVMEKVGDKSVTRHLMKEAGLPLLPGTVEPVATFDDARKIAEQIGYPIIIKASAGGGGRGITVVHDPKDLEHAYRSTRNTARAVFRDSAVYVESYLASARHIEVQVVCDSRGGAIHLGERDCSVQRRHQKLLEEAPSPNVTADARQALGELALRGARAIGYQGAGTVEFLMDDDGNFWFMEMNARIQVEHPVTEMVTGVDLIREQILVADGQPLSIVQRDVELRGHALECRINAENVERGFAPTPGRIDTFEVPGGPWTRVDTYCVAGSVISPLYDSMIAKLIVWGPDRPTALNRMRRALDEFRVSGRGVSTTIPFHQRVLSDSEFRAGDVRTDFVERRLAL